MIGRGGGTDCYCLCGNILLFRVHFLLRGQHTPECHKELGVSSVDDRHRPCNCRQSIKNTVSLVVASLVFTTSDKTRFSNAGQWSR